MKVMVDPAFPGHRKVRSLARMLKINQAQAVGHVLMLWCRVMSESPTGSIESWSDMDIASSAGWEDDPARFVQAMVDAKMIDGERVVHSWIEHQGDVLAKREAWRKQQRESREKRMSSKSQHSVSADSNETLSLSATSVPFPSLPVPSVPSRTTTGATSADSVMAFLFALAQRQKIAATESTLRGRLESWIARIGAQAVEQKLSDPSAVGRTVNELHDLWFPRPNGKTQSAQNGMNGNAPKCGVCADTGKVAVGVKDGSPELGDCSCVRRKTAKA